MTSSLLIALIVLLPLAAIAVAGVVGALRIVARDGYRQTPTRTWNAAL